MFITGSSANDKLILDNGPWVGGLTLRSTRKACFLSAQNPQEHHRDSARSTGKGLDDESG